jgi:hypothetical protein
MDKWYQVAGVFRATSGPDTNNVYAGTKELYVNGKQVATRSVSYKANTSYQLDVGTHPIGGGTYNLVGYVDEVSVWHRDLPFAEIEGNYKMGSP